MIFHLDTTVSEDEIQDQYVVIDECVSKLDDDDEVVIQSHNARVEFNKYTYQMCRGYKNVSR